MSFYNKLEYTQRLRKFLERLRSNLRTKALRGADRSYPGAAWRKGRQEHPFLGSGVGETIAVGTNSVVAGAEEHGNAAGAELSEASTYTSRV